MFSWLKDICKDIKDLNFSVDKYTKDSIIQSLPTVASVNRAKKLIENKKFDEAEIILKKALDISQQDSKVYKYLGKISERRMNFAEAIEYYQKSSKLNPHDKEIWLRLGMSQLNNQMIDEAVTSFEQADKVSPLNTDVYTGWGMALMKQKKYALARDKFLTASKISKYNFTAILLSAIMEIRLQDYDSAEMKLQFLAKVAPNESSTYEYSKLKLLKSDYDSAIRYAHKAIEINKQMLPAYFILGEVYSIKKDKEKTNQIFEKALKNDLDSTTTRFEWGKAYIRLFEFQKAKEQFTLSLEKDNTNTDAKIGLALVNAYENNFEYLNELKEKYGNNVYIEEALGLEKLNSQQYEDAIDFFKKALRTDPKQSYNYYNLVLAYKGLNDNYKIREYFEKFTRDNPNYLQGFIDFAKWLIEVEDYADAQRKLRRAEKLEPNNVEVLNLLFLTLYTLVIKNVCEYNIRETISIAEKAKNLGQFLYEDKNKELENILNDIQGRK